MALGTYGYYVFGTPGAVVVKPARVDEPIVESSAASSVKLVLRRQIQKEGQQYNNHPSSDSMLPS